MEIHGLLVAFIQHSLPKSIDWNYRRIFIGRVRIPFSMTIIVVDPRSGKASYRKYREQRWKIYKETKN